MISHPQFHFCSTYIPCLCYKQDTYYIVVFSCPSTCTQLLTMLLNLPPRRYEPFSWRKLDICSLLLVLQSKYAFLDSDWQGSGDIFHSPSSLHLHGSSQIFIQEREKGGKENTLIKLLWIYMHNVSYKRGKCTTRLLSTSNASIHMFEGRRVVGKNKRRKSISEFNS